MYAVGKAITKIVARLVTGSRGSLRVPLNGSVSAYARLARACSRLVRVIRWLTRVISWLITGTKHSGKPLACAATAVAIITPAASSSQASGYPTPQAVAAHAEFLLNAPPPPSQAAVCVIDTGVSVIPELEGKVIARRALDGGTLDDVWHDPANPASGHGTFVASAIAGSPDGRGGAGIWPQAKIVSVRVFQKSGASVSGAEWVNAIHRCRRASSDVKVINISLGGASHTIQNQTHLQTTLDWVRGLGVNVVAAAGNNGSVQFPASFSNITSVGGMSTAGLCSFPQHLPDVQIFAPGCGTRLPLFGGTTGSIEGTSIAAPFVSGAMSALRSYRSDLKPQEAEELLLKSARQTDYGRVVDAEAMFVLAGLGSMIPRPSSGSPSSTPKVKPRIQQSALVKGTFRKGLSTKSKPARVVVRPPKIERILWRKGKLLVRTRAPRRGELIVLRTGRITIRSRTGRFLFRLRRLQSVQIHKVLIQSGRRSKAVHVQAQKWRK